MAERIPGARRRMLSTRISLSKKVGMVSWAAEAIYTRIIPHVDDAGRLTADLEELRGTIVPLGKKGKAVSLKQLREWLEELHNSGLIILYAIDGDEYLQVTKFQDFQTFKSDRSLSIICPDPTEDSMWNPCGIQRADNGIPSLGLGLGLNQTKPNGYREDFEEWYIIYPRKKGKAKASEYYATHRAAGISRDDLILTCHKLIDEIQREGTEMKFVPYASTFLGPSGKFMDYLDGTKSPTCSTCNSWTNGYCDLRKEETDEEATCSKWSADIREGE